MINLGGIIFSALCALFAWLVWESRPRADQTAPSGMLLGLRSALPPFLLLCCLVMGLVNSPLNDTLRLRARALEVDTATETLGGAPAITVGGGEGGEPDLEAPMALHLPYVNFAIVDLVRKNGRSATSVKLLSQAQGDVVTLVSYEIGDDGDRKFVGAVPLTDGDRICLNDCAGAAPRWFVFSTAGQFTSEGRTVAIHRRPGLPGLLHPWGPEAAIYPLRTYFAPTGSIHGGLSEVDPCVAQACADAFAATPRAPARSFLFEAAGRWWLMLLDPGAEARHAPGGDHDKSEVFARGEVTRSESMSDLGALGQVAVHVRIGRVLLPARCEAQGAPSLRDRLSQWIGEAGRICGNSTLNERRSFKLLQHQRPGEPTGPPVVALRLDTPEYHAMGTWKDPRAHLNAKGGKGDDDHETLDDAASLSLDAIKGRGREGSILNAAVDDFARAFADYTVRGGSVEPLNSKTNKLCVAGRFEICAGNSARAIRFQIDRMRIPWMLFGIAALGALVFHVSSLTVWRVNAVDSVILALTQFLLILRTIIAVEGAFMDTAFNWRLLYAESAVDMIALPTLLIALRARADSRASTLVALLGFNLAAYAAAWLWLGSQGGDGSQLTQFILAALAIGGLTARLLTLGPPRSRLADLFASGLARPPIERWRPLLLLLLLPLARALLPLIGIKERVGPILVSVVYLPLLLLGLALVVARAERAAPAQRMLLGLLFVGFALAGVGAPALARDNGFLLVFVWPILGFGLWRGLVWREERKDNALVLAPWIAPVPILAGSYLVLMAVMAVWAAQISPLMKLDRQAPNDILAARMEKAIALSDGNKIRLMAIGAPAILSELGTKAAGQQMEQTVHLVERTERLFGRGYMHPSNLPVREDPNFGVLREVHLTDNVSAVHLMAPFGRAAAVAFLAVLAAVAVGLCAGRPAEVWREWPTAAGGLAIWTIFGAAAYMILANLLLVPFTGRDIYLLAPSSGSDLLEGLALLAMARIGLDRDGAR